MEQPTISYAPLAAGDRIQSLDIMRGIVLCGILLMNITAFGLYGSYSNPTVSGGSTGFNLFSWYANNMLFEGTMRALFSLLFGVGMFVLLDRLEKKGAGISGADIYFRRLTWLLVFGLIHGYLLLWTGEILFDYALLGFIVYAFRNWRPRNLVIAVAILLSVGTLWSFIDHRSNIKFRDQTILAEKNLSEGKELTGELKEAHYKWDKMEREKSPEFVAEYNKKMQGNYFALVAHRKRRNQYL